MGLGSRPPVYGLDIETDTSVDGLDPERSSVVTVALSQPGFDEVFSGDEPELLADLDSRLADLEPGVLATWNGAAFDLPFLAHRARWWSMRLGLTVLLDPTIPLAHDPLPGHRGAYRACWHDHGHVDAYRLYRGDVGPALRVSCSLKSIARFVGLAPIEVDRERIHDLSREALHAYAASDARLARVLTERRWGTASRFVDRLDRVPRPDFAVTPPR
jgi:uncharacterized protein YprB with RNaseH-like and TPR domain